MPERKNTMQALNTLACFLLPAVLATTAMGQTPAPAVQVEGAWARASVQGQMGTGAFMKLTAPDDTRLVAVSSPAAGVAEVHEMKMDGNVMTMRAVPALDLPAGKAVEFKPGGYHVMLMDLKAPLAKGSVVPLTFTFKDAKGVESKLELKVPVSAAAPSHAGADGAMESEAPQQTKMAECNAEAKGLKGYARERSMAGCLIKG
jgi:copper(I)-binding protein